MAGPGLRGARDRPHSRVNVMFRLRYIALGLAIVLMGFWWLSTDVSAPNERSRIYCAVDLVDHRTLTIDNAIDRFGPISDRAERNDHTYTDKAPGSSLLAAVIYGLVRLVTDAEDWDIEALLLLMRFGLMIPLTLAGLWLLRRLLHNLEFDPPIVDMASIAWLVATPVLHYGQAFYGHQIVAVCLLGAITCLWREHRRPWHYAAAGALAGIAGLTEYQAAIPCILLAIWVLTGPSRHRPRQLTAFFGAAIPFAALLLTYHNAVFGGPFELSYHHLAEASFEERHSRGIGGVTGPSREAIYGGFLSLHRGLFTTAPIIIFALAGIGPTIERLGRRRGWIFIAMLAYFAFFVASSNTWFAGWSYGPRLLIPAFAIGAVPMAFGLEKARPSALFSALAVAAFAVGLVSNLAMKMTFFEVPPSSENPLVDVALPTVAEGISSPSVATALGMSPATGIAIATVIATALFLIVQWMYLNDDRHTSLTLAIAFTAVFFAAVYATGPSWDDAQFQRFEQIQDRVLVYE